MSETYTTIISNVKDDDGDNVNIKIIFKKKDWEFEWAQNAKQKRMFPIIVSAEAFDSKGRYFYVEKLQKEFEHYVHISEKCKLNDIRYDNFEGQISIYLEGGGWNDNYGLEEQKNSPYHLREINKKIVEVENQLEKLKEKKIQIEKFYQNLNLI